MIDEKTVVDEEQADETKSVNAELETMIEEFGRERGLDYYLAGKTIEEARADDYEELKASRKSAEAEKSAAAEAEAPAEDAKKELEALKALVARQGRDLTALKAAVRRGDPVGATEPVVDAGARPAPRPANAILAAAEKFRRMGTTRRG